MSTSVSLHLGQKSVVDVCSYLPVTKKGCRDANAATDQATHQPHAGTYPKTWKF